MITAPSHLNKTQNIRKVMTASYGLQYATGVYDARSRGFTQWYPRDYSLRINRAHANPNVFEFRHSLPQQEIWIENIRRASDVYTLAFTAAGETSPAMNIDTDLLTLQWCADLCKHILSADKGHAQAAATLEMLLKPESQGGEGLNEKMAALARDLEGPLQEPPYPVMSMRGV